MLLRRNKVHQRNQTMLQNFNLQMQPQAVPVFDSSLSKVTHQKILVSSDLGIDLDHVQEITRVFIEPSNHEPHISRLQNQTRLFTPLSCDLEPDISLPVSDFSISKVTHKKILVSSDLGPDLDPVQAIARVFVKPSDHEPHTSRLRNHTRFFTPLSCDIEPDILLPTSRNIVISSDMGHDPSAGLDYGGVIAQDFRGPFLLNSSCHDFEKF